jgi:hypothetical protein
MASDLPHARNEVLQLIGRNLLFFQQVEVILKYLLRHGRLSGSVDEIREMLEKWDRKTMGQLVEPLIETILTPFDFPENELGSRRIVFSQAFTVKLTAEERAAFQQDLESLVAERNELVHHALTRFPLKSIEQCHVASEAFRQQREKFVAFRNRIQSWARTIFEFHLTIKEELKDGGLIDEEMRKQFRSD